jgi:glc operon protein GlcG
MNEPAGHGMDAFRAIHQLTLAGARKAGLAVEALAERNGWLIATVIVDISGLPLYAARMTGAILASYPGAYMKSLSALKFARPTSMLEASVASGKQHYFAFEDTLPVAGGVPIVLHGDVIGAIGVGGGPGGREATLCAEAGLAALGLDRSGGGA